MSNDDWLQQVPFRNPNEAAAAAERHEEEKRRGEDEADQQRAIEHLQLQMSMDVRELTWHHHQLSMGASEQICQPGPWTCKVAYGGKPAVLQARVH